MFNVLANYLLGHSDHEQQQQQQAGGVEGRNIRLTSLESEDDWVLVERDSAGNSEVDSSSSIDSLDSCGATSNPRRPTMTPRVLTRSSSTSSLPCSGTGMEESWFVTPPPCFTSAGPIHMETSPLENLLIEHPSMSVYQHSAQSALVALRHNSAPVLPSGVSADEEQEELGQVLEEVIVRRVEEDGFRDGQVQHVPLRNRVNIIGQQEQQWLKNKQAQKVSTIFLLPLLISIPFLLTLWHTEFFT